MMAGLIALNVVFSIVASAAFPLTTGMSILGVQVVAAKWLFHEPIDVMQWTGTLLIGAGIFLVQR